MHGIVLSELERFLITKAGLNGWESIKASSGLSTRVFVQVSTYPDEEAQTLLASAARRLNWDSDRLLREFGVYLAPSLMRRYRFMVRPEWKTLELLEHTESVLHAAVRKRTPDATPPRLVVRRMDANQVLVSYASRRRMCALVHGIIQGLAQVYEERIEVVERQCMNKGAASCRLQVDRLPEGALEPRSASRFSAR